MDTRQLAAFCAVVERGSFSQAAERLGVTQPAVSLQIRSLEKRLGRQLLDRVLPGVRDHRIGPAAVLNQRVIPQPQCPGRRHDAGAAVAEPVGEFVERHFRLDAHAVWPQE